jgi:hypothetical protein
MKTVIFDTDLVFVDPTAIDSGIYKLQCSAYLTESHFSSSINVDAGIARCLLQPTAFKLDFYKRLLSEHRINCVLSALWAFDKSNLFESRTAILELTYTFISFTCYDT